MKLVSILAQNTLSPKMANWELFRNGHFRLTFKHEENRKLPEGTQPEVVISVV